MKQTKKKIKASADAFHKYHIQRVDINGLRLLTQDTSRCNWIWSRSRFPHRQCRRWVALFFFLLLCIQPVLRNRHICSRMISFGPENVDGFIYCIYFLHWMCVCVFFWVTLFRCFHAWDHNYGANVEKMKGITYFVSVVYMAWHEPRSALNSKSQRRNCFEMYATGVKCHVRPKCKTADFQFKEHLKQ